MAWIGGIALLIPLLSALTSPVVPFGCRAALAALWIVAIAHPHRAITALMVVAPAAPWFLAAFGAPQVRYAEALVLATMSGALIAAARPRATALEGQPPHVAPAAIVFGAIAAASAAVTLRVTEIGTRTPWPFLQALFNFLTGDYLIGPSPSFPGLPQASLVIEGLGLMFLAARHSRDHVTRPPQLFAAAAVGGTLNALLVLTTSGKNTATVDAHATAAFLVMSGLVALALAANRRVAGAAGPPTRQPRWGTRSWRPAIRAMWAAAATVMLVAAFPLTLAATRPAAPLRPPAFTVFGAGIGRGAGNVLLIGDELGVIGLAAIAWLIGVVAIRAVRGLHADPGDRLLMGALTGLAAFVAACAIGRPLLIAESVYPFWILLGAAITRADGNVQRPPTPDVAPPSGAPRLYVAVLASAALAASVPHRAAREASALDFTTQSFGFYSWENDAGERFRWTGRRATFFIPLTTRHLFLPIRATRVGAATGLTEASILVGGRLFRRVRLAQDEWVNVDVRLPLTPEDEAFQRIDIIPEPVWWPAGVLGDDTDLRVLGVQVGEPVIRP
jgi:hypothetical protein